MTSWQQKGTQRIRYYQDQLLTARDLQDDAAYEMNLHNLQIQAIHDTWGIALGFECELLTDQITDQTTHQKFLQVGPGLAYDYWGRAIVSASAMQIQLPESLPHISSGPICWFFDLIVRYGDWASLQTGDYPNEEGPLWRWSLAGKAIVDDPPLANDVQLGKEIPLVRLKIQLKFNQQQLPTFAFDLDFSLRRYVQPLVRPHIASGQIAAGSSVGGDSPLLKLTGCPLAWSAQINTTAGKFSSAGQPANPSYFVNLVDHPFSPSSRLTQWFTPDELKQFQQKLLGPFISIQDPTPNRFTLNVRFAASSRKTLEDLLKNTLPLCRERGFTLPVAVHWVGVESLRGCPPESLEIWRLHMDWGWYRDLFPLLTGF
jgi:hypothetical protein